jgi:sortase (surface protein transpeptidase)
MISAVVLIFLLIPNHSPSSLSTQLFMPTIVQAPQYVAGNTLAKSITSTLISEPVTPGTPVRLKIPRLKIDAKLESVGRTNQGAMGVPQDIANAAWFNLGPHPGEIGSAVIDGHYGWKDNVPAVFDPLHKLHVGDRIDVVDEHGLTASFEVRQLRTYAQNDDASNVFESGDEKAHLNLITCQGDWNEDQHSYPDRLVVFTDRVKTD